MTYLNQVSFQLSVINPQGVILNLFQDTLEYSLYWMGDPETSSG